MKWFRVELKYKDIFILKHSLERRIKEDEECYIAIKDMGSEVLTEKGKKFKKEHEEHKRCLDNLIEEMKRLGYKHGDNIFGRKYRD